MAIASSSHNHPEDPLYRTGMAHLQAGEWEKATQVFGELTRRYPDDPEFQRALDEVEFKASLDAGSHIKGKRWILPGLRLVVPVLIVVMLLALVWLGIRFAGQYISPLLNQAQVEQKYNRWLAEGDKYLQAERWDDAEASYQRILDENPDHVQAQAGLAKVAYQRQLLANYQGAVAWQESGNLEMALKLFQDIARVAPGYRDVSYRITQIQRQIELKALFARATVYAKTAHSPEAILKAVDLYKQIRNLDDNYQRDVIAQRLVESYLQLGQGILQQPSPSSEQMAQALSYFNQALSLNPSNSQVKTEKNLAQLYVDGQDLYDSQNWDLAVTKLEQVYDQRPDYLDGQVVELLYTAYLHSGDQYLESDNLGRAKEQYLKATQLPLNDVSAAEAGLAKVNGRLAPTPAPPVSRSAYVAPAAAAPAAAAPAPTPTPQSLLGSHGRIVFLSSNAQQPGLWMMDPSGENRVYLGNGPELHRQYQTLYEQETLSPTGQKVFVRDTDVSPQLFVARPNGSEYRLTFLTGVSYDPVWSPDGSQVAFVSQELKSDDVWVINADSSNPHALTSNEWEWDKHPSWSPDGTQIAFWSNRTSMKQIYVMNADGSEPVNISNAPWNEYDPIWVK